MAEHEYPVTLFGVEKEYMNSVYTVNMSLLYEDEQYAYYGYFNEDEKTHKLNEIQKALDKAGYEINAINEYRSARRHITDIMYKAGLVSRRNKYQNAKEDVGFKFNDFEMVNELFDALNKLDFE